jgi:transposase
MYISRSKFKTKSGKDYESILLRHSYRVGKKVKKKTIANLTKCSKEEIAAIELALKHKHDLTNLGSFPSSVKLKEGLSFGACFVILETAKKLGITSALGNSREAKLALWQIIARVLDQGSRLSSVRLAETHALASILDFKKGFTEDNLYKNLKWLNENQSQIEDKLFEKRNKNKTSNIFLYDVTSSYLEGTENELADWGYNRDGKKGKKQIVIGLLCDEDGVPMSTQVFKGNTNDTATFASQIQKAKNRFNCKKVIFVGDRGMIKSGQIEDLEKHGFHYITAITKKQIETLLKKDIIQYEIFDENVSEIEENNIRYILRRNPIRASEISKTRDAKKESVENLVKDRNLYLKNHPCALEKVAKILVENKIKRLNISSWISVKSIDRKLILTIDKEKLEESSLLDGCYVIKTDIKKEELECKKIHSRYKDLALVESAFRTSKTNLEVRPIYVRSEQSTYGHVFVVMLSYMIMQELDKCWKELYLTVEEGLKSLSTLCVTEVFVNKNQSFQCIPNPRAQNKKMLEASKIKLPKFLPKNNVRVVTRVSRRKSVQTI